MQDSYVLHNLVREALLIPLAYQNAAKRYLLRLSNSLHFFWSLRKFESSNEIGN